jgi:hypothetical protein
MHYIFTWDRWVDRDMFMRYIGGGIGHLTLGVGQDKTNNDGMDIDSEVDEDMPHEHSDGAHFVSQPHTLAPVVIEGDQDDVMLGVDNDGNVSDDSDDSDGSDDSDDSDDSDESGASDDSDSDTDQDSEKSASDSEDGEDSGDDDGYASL